MKERFSYLTVAQEFDLATACRVAEVAFRDISYGVYQVGSTLTRPDWRDVDLRCMLEDDQFDALFKDNVRRLKFLNVAISEWMAARSGLPVDFQFQRQTDANREFCGPRNAVGLQLE